jgi:hypothetical protein
VSEKNRLRRRYALASIGLLVAVGAAYALGAVGFGVPPALMPFAVAFVCAEVIRRTAVRIERAAAKEPGRRTWVRQLREGDVLEDHKGLGTVTAVRHRGPVSHVFGEDIGLIFYVFERVRVRTAGGE